MTRVFRASRIAIALVVPGGTLLVLALLVEGSLRLANGGQRPGAASA